MTKLNEIFKAIQDFLTSRYVGKELKMYRHKTKKFGEKLFTYKRSNRNTTEEWHKILSVEVTGQDTSDFNPAYTVYIKFNIEGYGILEECLNDDFELLEFRD